MAEEQVSDDRLASATDIRAPMRNLVESGHVTGGVALVWHGGQTVYCAAEGCRDVDATTPMTRDALFRIASMTKPITSLAMLMMIEAGMASLDSPISRWLPEFAHPRVLLRPDGPLDETRPAARAITIEDLLTHRAGLAYAFNSDGPLVAAYEERLGPLMIPRYQPDQWIARLADLPLTYDPGDRFHYSHATDLLGFLIGRIAEKPFRDVLREMILIPLGMEDTDFWVRPEERDRLVELCRFDAATGRLASIALPQPDAAPDFCGGGGGMISTVDDYLLFARLMLNGGAVDGVRLARPETIALMTTNRLTPRQRSMPFLDRPLWETHGFGLGVSILLDAPAFALTGAGAAGAFGWPGVYGTHWQADPTNDLITIFLTQTIVPLGPDTANGASATRDSLTRLTYQSFQQQVYTALA